MIHRIKALQFKAEKLKERWKVMLGLQDLNIVIVFSLCILCSVFCVVYGIWNWNKGQESESEERPGELLWEETEDKLNELL